MVTFYDEDAIPAVYNKADIPSIEPREGVSFQYFRGNQNMVGFVTAEPGGQRNRHTHPWEQIVCVVGGEADFYLDGEEFSVAEGDVFFVPPNAEHELIPKPDVGCNIIAVWPVREPAVPRTSYQTEFQTDSD